MAKTRKKTTQKKRRKTSKQQGCALTTLLSLMIFVMVGLIAVVGYLYLKESNWFQMRQGSKHLASHSHKKKTNIYNNSVSPYAKPQPNTQVPHTVKKSAPVKIPVTKTQPIKKTVVKKTVTKTQPVKKKISRTVTKSIKKPIQKKKTAISPKKTTTKKTTTSTPKKAVQSRIKIYLTKYDEKNDKIILKPVYRSLKNTESPLRTALNRLLSGPTDAEDNSGYSSSIPGGVKLLSLSIKNGVAYIDFNSQFEFGTGTKIMYSRVYQVVFTATQFSTVNKVQILLNGQKKTNFAGEGLDLSHSLSRRASLAF